MKAHRQASRLSAYRQIPHRCVIRDNRHLIKALLSLSLSHALSSKSLPLRRLIGFKSEVCIYTSHRISSKVTSYRWCVVVCIGDVLRKRQKKSSLTQEKPMHCWSCNYDVGLFHLLFFFFVILLIFCWDFCDRSKLKLKESVAWVDFIHRRPFRYIV